eukprot:c775_g1_i1.p1 GENE.c775_g1_i1~~c775_g1_i1.p1  ORF type:complete len:666 (-),score=218.34 c775_g1_i1:286-2283(-)
MASSMIPANFAHTDNVIPVPEHLTKGASMVSMDHYHAEYKRSLEHNHEFWAEVARKYVSFFHDFSVVQQGSLAEGNIAWFLNGQLNVSYNCIDRHAATNPDKVAILWEGDTPDQIRKITYRELLAEVCKLANALTSLGVRKGDTVTIYMPMIPEAAFAMLACARLGAIHSVVFAGFSAIALAGRVEDAKSRVIITANVGLRGGKSIPLKKICDDAIKGLNFVEHVIVYQRNDTQVHWTEGRDIWYHTLLEGQRPYCPPVWCDSEDILFILYTSGSTGKPKGMAHTTAGYLVYATFTCQMTFDLKPDSIFACVADVGWITGHSYIVYGPLANNTTTFMFESVPTFPDADRYWDMVERHKIDVFYTAPTAIRALKRHGDEHHKKHDLSSLRVLGSVGEPINPEAWVWYKSIAPNTTIVDTFWQTETGGHMISGYGGVTPMKPGSASFPALGIEVAVLDSQTGKELTGNSIEGVLCVKRPWPGMARTIYGDHPRFVSTYFSHYPGFYFTGDGCQVDKDGYIWITGRVDDVLNVSGHRLGTAEVESALVAHKACSEAAVVGCPHDIKLEGIFCYVVLQQGLEKNADLVNSLKHQVRAVIGAWATPDVIAIVEALPKTRSGKIMRRILRKVAAGERNLANLGDLSTLADPHVIDKLVAVVEEVHPAVPAA